MSWPSTAQDCQAVGLKFDFAADHRLVEPEAGVERRQGDRDALLDVVDAQALEAQPLSRHSVGADPLDIDEAAQHVVAGDVVLAGDGLVGRGPERAGHAPQGVELGLAIAFEIAAQPTLFAGIVVGQVRIVALAVGQEAADLEGADPVELAVARLDRRQGACIDVRRKGQVAVAVRTANNRGGPVPARYCCRS